MKDIANAFMVFDINKKKCLEIDDISKVLDSHNLGLPPGTVEDLFKAIDTDGNGKIEFKEFEGMMKQAADPASKIPGILDNFIDAAKKEVLKQKKERLKQFSNVSDEKKDIANNPLAQVKEVVQTEVQKKYTGISAALINTGSKQFWRFKTRVDYNIYTCEEIVILQPWNIDSQKVYPEVWIKSTDLEKQIALESAANLAGQFGGGGGSQINARATNTRRSSAGRTSIARKPSAGNTRETWGGSRNSVVQVASKTFKEQDAKLAEFIAKRITFTPDSPDSPVAGQGVVKVAKLTDDAFTEENFFFSAAEQEEIRATGFALVAPELHTVTSSEDISSKIASVNSDLTTARRNSSTSAKYAKLLQTSIEIFGNMFSKLNEEKARVKLMSRPQKRWYFAYKGLCVKLRRNRMVDLLDKVYPNEK
jgi:hypothetical protein